jgi:hypothetical protein
MRLMPLPVGNCPKCDDPVKSVNLREVSIKAPGGNWVGVSYQCSNCNAVLSVGIDPIALKTDIVNEVLEGLRKR